MTTSVDNLNRLNYLATGALAKLNDNEGVRPITEDGMFPVVECILESLVREYLPPQHEIRHANSITCTIIIEGDVLRKSRLIIDSGKPLAEASGFQTANYRHFQLDEHFTYSVICSAFHYIFNKDLYQLAPAGICANRDYSLFTITMTVNYSEIATALELFISKNENLKIVQLEKDNQVRILTAVENTNAYIKSVNDKLNEVSATLNDARKEIVEAIALVKRVTCKVVDIVTPLSAHLLPKPKADKKK